MAELKDNQMLSPDGDILTLQNPKFDEAEVLWPDGSVFPIWNAKLQLSEDNLQRYLAWHAKEVQRMMAIILRAADHCVHKEDTHKQPTLVYNKTTGRATLQGVEGADFRGQYPKASAAFTDCVERGFEPQAYCIVS